MNKKIIERIKSKPGLNKYDERVLDVVIENPKITKEELARYPVKIESKTMRLNNDYIAQKYIDWVNSCLQKI